MCSLHLCIPGIYNNVRHLVFVKTCLLHGCLPPPSSAHICCDLGTDLSISGLLQSSPAGLWLLPSPPWLESPVSLLACTVHSSQSGCIDYFETEVRPRQCSAPDLPVYFHLSQRESQVLTQAGEALRDLTLRGLLQLSSRLTPLTHCAPATAAAWLLLHHILPGPMFPVLCQKLLAQISSWLLLQFHEDWTHT